MSTNQYIKERVDALASTLDKNKISYNNQFINLTSVAYDKEEYNLEAFKLVDYLEKLVKYGINNGFKTVKDDIKKITNIIVELSKINKITKFEKLKKEEERIMENSIQFEDCGLIKKPLLDLIQNTMDGIETIKQEKNYEDRIEILDNVNKKLEEFNSRIIKLFDNYSVLAYENSKRIYENILILRQKVAYGSLSSISSKKLLKTIDDEIMIWENQKDANLKKAKVDKDYKFDPTFVDKFYIATNSAEFFEGFDLLKKEAKKFYSTIIDDSRINEIMEKQNEAISKKEEIQNKAQEIKAQYDAKRISKEEAAAKLRQLQLQQAIEDDVINSTNNQLNKFGASKYFTNKKIYDIANNICEIVDENRMNKEFIYVLSQNFNIDSVLSLFSGNPSTEDVVNVKESFKNAKIFASEQNAAIKEAVDGVKIINDIFDDEEELDISEEFVTKKPKQTTDAELDDLFGSLGVSAEKEEEKEKKEEQDQEVDINNFIK